MLCDDAIVIQRQNERMMLQRTKIILNIVLKIGIKAIIGPKNNQPNFGPKFDMTN